MAIVVKLKKKKGNRSIITPLQKKLLEAPPLSKKQIKQMEEATKYTGKWKI